MRSKFQAFIGLPSTCGNFEDFSTLKALEYKKITRFDAIIAVKMRKKLKFMKIE